MSVSSSRRRHARIQAAPRSCPTARSHMTARGTPFSSVLHTPADYFGYTTIHNATNGKIAAVQYPSGLVEQFIYNQYGYLCRVSDNSGAPTCTNAGGAQVFFTVNARDAELHLTQSTAGNGITTNQAFSPLTSLIRTQTAGPGNSVANFAYAFDTIGNLTSRTDSREGLNESFCYDALNRLTNYANGPSCLSGTSATYDSGIPGTQYRIDGG